MGDVPIYAINEFNTSNEHFYVNHLDRHLKKFQFVHVPHKHDFYLCVVFTKGTGVHEIDFIEYEIKPGTVFFLTPGRFHNWRFKTKMKGYIFFHSKDFYNLNYQNREIQDFPFYFSAYNAPYLKASEGDLKEISQLFRSLFEESSENKLFKEVKLCSFVDLIYINLARLYISSNQSKIKKSDYTVKLRQLEVLVDQNFFEKKRASDYSNMLNITTKHLNRIVKTTLNKTVSMFIADRVILEAKRILVHSNFRVSEIAEKLGFIDYSYFNRYFKKHTGHTPTEFSSKYRKF